MDDTPESFAYRCLPLNIANAHGWELLSPCGFEAIWNGSPDPSGVTLRLDDGAGLAVRPGGYHFPRRGPVAHPAGLEHLDRRFAKPAQGRHSAPGRRGRDR